MRLVSKKRLTRCRKSRPDWVSRWRTRSRQNQKGTGFGHMVTSVSFPGGLVVSAQQECCSWTLRAITKLLLRRPDGHVFLHKEDLWWELNYELVPARPGQLLHHWHRSAGVTRQCLPEEVGHAPVNTGAKHLQLTKHTTSPWDWASLYCVLYFAEENREAVFAEMTSVDKKKPHTTKIFSHSSSWAPHGLEASD